jgi:hypothetical protein
MTCTFCHNEKPDVEIQRDPFAWTVNDEDWQIPLCDDCAQTRADDA